MQRLASIAILAAACLSALSSQADPDPFLHQTVRQLDQVVSARTGHALIDMADVDERRRGFGGWYHFDGQGTSDDAFPVELHARSYQPMVGGDFSSGRLTVGGGIGINGVDAKFRAAQGASPTFPTERVNAALYTVAPYLAYAFDEQVYATLLAGYQHQEWSRFDNLVPRDLDAEAGFWNVGLHALGELGELGDEVLRLRGDVGFTHEMTKRSRQSLVNDFIANVGLDASFPLGAVAPYARSWYELAFDDDSSSERHIVYVGAGLRIDLSERVSLDLGGWTGAWYQELRETNFAATLRFAVP